MRFAKGTRLCVALVVIAGIPMSILGCERAGDKASSKAEAAPDGATQHATGKPPPIPAPIPEAGPLARPKSLQQVCAPVDARRAAIPPHNPQTTEKIALVQKRFC